MTSAKITNFDRRVAEGLRRARIERARSFHAFLFGRRERERAEG